MEKEFANKIDNESVDIFIQKIKNNTPGQAYIFLGQDEFIKLNTIYKIFKILNCLNLKNFVPCEECSQCIKINNQFHTDFIEIKLLEDKQTISITQITELYDVLKFQNFEAKYRFVVLHSADELSREAANSFLKLLEEPPVNTLYFLLCENINNLLSTIISRCNVIKFKPVDIKEMLLYYSSKSKFDENKIQSIINTSNNKITDIELFLIEKDFIAFRDNLIEEILYFIETKKFSDILPQIEKFYNSNQRIKNKEKKNLYRMKFFEIINSIYRDILVYKTSGNPDFIINIDYKQKIKNIVENVSSTQISTMLFIIFNSIREIYHNLNMKVVLDDLFLKKEELLYDKI